MSQAEKQMKRAIELLRDIRCQEFITDAAWDCKELRRWIKKTDRLLGDIDGN
jgi:hypothetical protein